MAVKLRYTSPPLPFIGNKRNWLRPFAEAIRGLPASTVFVDCFGGSGILSRTAADTVPGAKVIYNDFDGYADRVAGIPVTNAILRELRGILDGVPRGARVPDGVKAQGLEILRRYRELFGGIDEATVTSNVAFSSRSIEGGTAGDLVWYNKVRLSDIPEAPDYFAGLTVVREDFRALLDRYANDPDAVLILDPPYLSTQCGAYGAYGGLVLTLDLLRLMREKRFVLFSSESSEIEKPIQWLTRNVSPDYDVLQGAVKSTRHVCVSTCRVGRSEWTDIMYLKL